MHIDLVSCLMCPEHHQPLSLAVQSGDTTHVVDGGLACPHGHTFAIRDGVPRFAELPAQRESVESFGTEWNLFNFTAFKLNWLEHTVRNTFGSPASFRGKVIVDCGAGSGAQSRWMLESGADRVVALEMSHSIDGVMRRNLAEFANVDLIQCDISRPPFLPDSIGDIVICHNVIQHTRSVAETARALYRIVRPGGEFVFNCYGRNSDGLVRRVRFGYYRALRVVLSSSPEPILRGYAYLMSRLVGVPAVGRFLLLSMMAMCGDVPAGPGWSERRRRQTYLNTYDWYGSHAYQHHLSDDELKGIAFELQPDGARIGNLQTYFSRPRPHGIALRVAKSAHRS